MISLDLLNETEQRYAARAQDRAATQARLASDGLLAANPPDLVARRLRRLGIAAEQVQAAGVGSAQVPAGRPSLAMTVGPAAARAGDAVLERFIGRNDLLSVAYLDLAARVARSVGRIHIRRASGRLEGYGTGFMVSPCLLLTNHHVLEDAAAARYSEVEFDYQEGPDGRPLASTFFALQPDVFFVTDAGLDYTLVAVAGAGSAGASALRTYGWVPLLADDAKVLKGESLNIIQHPDGELKKVALRANDLVDMLECYLHYQTDTAPGSSGSPVFNDQWEVVALHHSGVPRRDAQGQILARDGRPWTEDMGEAQVDWIANEGIRISRIVEHLGRQPLPAAAEALCRQLLAAGPAAGPAAGASSPGQGAADPPGEVTSHTTGATQDQATGQAPGEASGALSSPAVAAAGPAASEDGVTWTIPLQVTVRLGQPVLHAPVTAASQPPAVAAGGLAAGAGLPRRPAEHPDLAAALAELDQAPERPYYDAAQDALDRAAYYGDLPGERSPEELFGALHDLLERTATGMANYNPLRRVYPWVDLQPDLKVRSLYTGQEFDAAAVMHDDVRIAQERAASINELLLAEAALSPADLAEKLDAVTASLPYNCEHTVCQSWFGAREPMRGDLHHLFACESGCNNYRGNTPFFDFPDFEEKVRTGCGKLETDRFEPSAGKGLVARATLYFLLRYPGVVNQRKPIYDEERLQTLLAWHNAYPVTDHERHRNQAIFQAQGNRNPLIDFPEWAGRIAFGLGLKSSNS